LTKKTPTPQEASWAAALAAFDDWQRTRGMGEKTRRAYGVDLAQLGEWAAERGLRPKDVSHRDLRRFAAVLGENGAAKSTVARKLAAIRSFYRQLIERGELDNNPADLVPSPKKGDVRTGLRGRAARRGADADRRGRCRPRR
jgi:site-specific recombinase XerD